MLKYVETFYLDPGSANATFVMNLNGMYDPNVAAGGHQPSNFDTWMQVYNKYAVWQCDVQVTALNTGPNQADYETGVYGFMVTQTGTDISSGTSFKQIAEQPYVKYALQTPGVKQEAFTALRAQVPVWEWLGVAKKEELLAEQDYQGTAAANPSRSIFAEIFYVSPIGNTVANPGYFQVELTFHAWVFLPRQTTFSLTHPAARPTYAEAVAGPAAPPEEKVEAKGWFG
jgi:hypothetical protein